jgi:undecaprenyl-diphosphatase
MSRSEESRTAPQPPDARVIMRREGRMLVYVAAAAGFAVILLAAASAWFGGARHSLDDRILLAFRVRGDLATPIGPAWLLPVTRDITTLGGSPVLTLLVVVLCGYLATKRSWDTIGLVLAAAVGQSLIVRVLKELFGRERPAIVPHLVDVSNQSFPSGHATSAAAIYLILGAILARSAAHGAQRVYVLLVAIAMTLIIGASRVYLGVHYPSDVIAGLFVGAVWASCVWLAAYYLKRRKTPQP